MVGYQLCGVPAWVVVDRLAQALWLPGQPNGLVGHLAAYSGHDHEAGAGLLTNWQLRIANLAVDTKPAEK